MTDMQHQFMEAGTLMLAGMVFVFAFLGLLILFINVVLSKFANKYPDPIASSSRKSVKKNKIVADKVSPAIVAAISGAVHQYRQQHSQSNIK